ncbi:winged helix-turn-helix transcriptional regulator [Streptomyces triticiradicis]|uniref:Helix-turn-helix transcriptional regulator n=1 Tax=Streptomyces triticiradicis TaxID=2651189 RepID=A0A7J5DI60_9ACTN|nr:helix-turn-helix domain-containing protein [Streptomyces triticiradicis]KAB1988333.1 helix-turn-helix transcriptional regulator [Streptomyces triticiradicis]
MAAMDLFGRRWALRILWELRAGPLGARALLARCEGLSSSVLYQRLRELTSSGIVARSSDGYGLTRTGTALGHVLRPLDEWATVWAREQERAAGPPPRPTGRDTPRPSP